MNRVQNAGWIQNEIIYNITFHRVDYFKDLGTTLKSKIFWRTKLTTDWCDEMHAIIGAQSFVFQVAKQKFIVQEL